MSDLPIVIAYTDGACSGNPGRGGWGVFLKCNSMEKELSGHESNTTNNRMELRAAIEALKALKKQSKMAIYTDSKYVKDGITSWVANWKKNGWQTAAKKPVKNVDLWQELEEIQQQHVVSWHWVKGHSGNEGNDRADLLATSAIKR